jgi:hypothetical protein
VFIGDISYSWYLWHWPLIVYAKALWPATGAAAPIAAAASLIPAWLSYRYVENPIRYGVALTFRNVAVITAICVALPVAAGVGLVSISDSIAKRPMIVDWLASQEPHLDAKHHCDGAVPGPVPIPSCTWRVHHARGMVVLVGDSNAGQFSDPFVRAANEAGFDAEVITHSGCPYADVVAVLPGIPPDGCRAWAVASLRAVVKQRPRLLIVANRTDYYLSNFLLGTPGGRLMANQAAKVRIWRSGLRRTLTRTNAAGVPVLLVRPVPMLSTPAGDCAVIRVLTSTCLQPVSRRKVDAELRQAVDVDSAVAASLPATRTISFEALPCTHVSCSSVRNDVLLYRDPRHLSVQGAELLTPRFYKAIVAGTR